MIKTMIEKNKNILIFIISILIVSFVKIDPLVEGNIFDKMSGNSLDYVIYIILLSIAISKLNFSNKKRMIIFSAIVAFILTMCQFLGNIIINEILFFSGLILLKTIGYFALFFILIMYVYTYIEQKENENNVVKYKISNKKLFFIEWGLILICYIPYLLKYFPGTATTDSYYQISQAIGNVPLMNTHPVLHTFIVSIPMKIGGLLGNYNYGVLIYSIMQMLFMSGVFAFCLYYMRKKEIPKIAVIFSFIFFAIFPVMPMYSITMWKDIPFGISILLYTISMIELATNADEFLKSKKKIAYLVVSALLTMFFKHNGFYIVLLSAPFVLFFIRRHLKKLVIIYVCLIIFYKIINGPVLTAMNIAPTIPSEALSIPIQQLSRVVAFAEDLSDDEFKEINKWILADRETIKKEYNPRISDPMKKYFNNDEFEKNKMSFIKVWAKYLIKYPKKYIESFFANNYGYWYPEAHYWMFAKSLNDEKLNLKKESKLDIELLDSVIEERNIPVVSMITSLGFEFSVTGIMMFYVIYRKKYKMIIIYVPALILWLTAMASSVFCEYRYLFGLIVCLPLIITIALKGYNEEIRTK